MESGCLDIDLSEALKGSNLDSETNIENCSKVPSKVAHQSVGNVPPQVEKSFD